MKNTAKEFLEHLKTYENPDEITKGFIKYVEEYLNKKEKRGY